ncbi:MAG: DUF3253 domain-containing protein [Xanthobacteraceae bacterium]|nr:MAG: DUF3253 domain-containing protein [Xanthobacteraceae bacterium]
MMVTDSTSRATASPLAEALLAALARHGADKTLSAPELAQEIAPQVTPGGDWHALIVPIRHAAVALALAGQMVIYRKGKPVDPSDFKGVYRLGLPRHD